MDVIAVEHPGHSLYTNPINNNENIYDMILNDSLIVYDKIKEIFGIPDKSILILGRSIGSVPATYLASKTNPGGLFLVSLFTSIKEVINNHSFNLGGLFVKSSFESIKYIRDVKCRTLLIHGLKDTLIPVEHSKQLFNEIKSSIKECHFVDEMTHNKFDPDDDLVSPIKSFLEKYEIIKNKALLHEINYNNLQEFQIPAKYKNYLK